VKKEKNPVLEKSFSFALQVLDVVKELNETRQFVLAGQVCKSGTSIGANIREAQRAQSKADFIHKMNIALKEAEETDYWFMLIDRKVLKIPQAMKEGLDELIRLLVSIINSAKRNNNQSAGNKCKIQN
jgi:four helix bundle protein